VELNDPIRLDDELQLCEECNRLTLIFLAAARDGVKNAFIQVVGQTISTGHLEGIGR
jgi:hypothetical protein